MSENKFYSQNGEDFLLAKIFKDKQNGFFVEVGCVDGRRFSNTLHFEEKGWDGLCIEAHNNYIDLLKENRPNSKIIHCAVGSTNKEEVTFYADKRGSLSSLDGSEKNESRLKRDYPSFSGFSEQKVVQKTLNTIFENNSVEKIDFLSIDIEGGEIDALKKLDFLKYNPRVLLVEFDSISNLCNLKRMMYKEGYFSGPIVGTNIFFSNESSDMKKIRGKVYNSITLIHTGIPITGEKDEKIKTEVNTTLLSKYKKLSIMAIMPFIHKIRDLLNIYD